MAILGECMSAGKTEQIDQLASAELLEMSP